MGLPPLPPALIQAAATLAVSAALAISVDTPAPKLDLATVLAHIGEVAEEARTTLPNFRCNEAVTSEQLDHDTIKRRVDFTADLRMRRVSDTQFTEIVGVLTLDGKPIDNTQNVDPPIYMESGLTSALYYFEPERLACYRFALSPGRLDFAAIPDIDRYPSCHAERGLQGFARLDSTGNVTHVERRLPDKVAAKLGTAPFAAIDFAPVEIDGRTYRLSSRMISERPAGHEKQLFEATYTACRPMRPTTTQASTVSPPQQ